MNSMKLYDIGTCHDINCTDGVKTITVIYNDGEVAICGFTYNITRRDSYDYDWEHYPFAMTKEEIKAFVPAFEYTGPYNSFVVIDLATGWQISVREWFRRCDALFIPGQKYYSQEEFDEYIGNKITVDRIDGTAIIKIFDGDGCVYDSFKKFGCNEEEVRSAFPEFKDRYPADCNEFFYVCVRECDDEWIDLHGNPIDADLLTDCCEIVDNKEL